MVSDAAEQADERRSRGRDIGVESRHRLGGGLATERQDVARQAGHEHSGQLH